MFRIIIVVLSSFLLFSCGLKEEEIPAYIYINDYEFTTRSFEGSNSSDFNGVWVLQDDVEQGVYEFPAKFPVLTSRGTNLKIFPGVTVNGISTTRSDFPFAAYYEYDHALEPGEVDTIVPKWEYAEFCSFVIQEDFESGNAFFNLERIQTPGLVFEGNVSAKMTRDSSLSSYFQAESVSSFYVPRTAPYAYLEMDYRNNVSFGVGLEANLANDPNTISTIKLNLNPQSKWNKIYINFYPEIQALNADEYRIVFRVQDQTIPDEDVEIYFDNIKLVYARDL